MSSRNWAFRQRITIYKITSGKRTIKKISLKLSRMRMKADLVSLIKWGGEDLILAFFPCIYFSPISQMLMFWGDLNYRKLTYKERTDAILQRVSKREEFFGLAAKMLCVAQERGIRLIMENPWSQQTYLKANFVLAPSLVDNNRRLRGDFYAKPTAYWFINCEPTNGFTEQRTISKKNIMSTKSSAKAGVCSEERSMISPDYARNFICDFILGKEQVGTQLNLF